MTFTAQTSKEATVTLCIESSPAAGSSLQPFVVVSIGEKHYKFGTVEAVQAFLTGLETNPDGYPKG